MVTIVETIADLLAAGVNPITALRDATGYTLDQIAVASGFALSDLTALEDGASVDAETLSRITSALGLPGEIVSGG